MTTKVKIPGEVKFPKGQNKRPIRHTELANPISKIATFDIIC